MIPKSSTKFRKFFMLAFTRELIKSGIPSEIDELKKILKINKKTSTRKLPPRKFTKKRLTLPQTRLPAHLDYLKPSRRNDFPEVDFGKLNPLIQDPNILDIECAGSGENIIVTGTMGKKPTNIFLTREEINEIIQDISMASKIPAEPGLYRVIVKNIVFSGVISKIASSRFIIQKINYNLQFKI